MRNFRAALGLIMGAVLVACSGGAVAFAQGAIQQSGPVVPFHLGAWYGNGVMGDAGSATSPLLSSFGLFNGPSCPFSVSSQTGPGPATIPYSQFGVCQTLGTTTLLTQGLGGASPPNTLHDIDAVQVFEESADNGGNNYFGSPYNFSVTSIDGVSVADLRWDGNNHYLISRGYTGAKDENAFNFGVYRYNGAQTAITQVMKYDAVRIDWGIGSDNTGSFAPASGYGRVAETGMIAAENQTQTARGGVYFLSATTLGTTAQPIQVWLHGSTGALNIAGSSAAAAISSVVDYPGYGAATIWAVDKGVQAALSIRGVAAHNANSEQGLDLNFNVSTGNYELAGVTGIDSAPTKVVTAVINPTTGAWAFNAPVIASGSPPTLTGTCTTSTQTGGNAAGSFHATCSSQTVIITFATTAPNGWTCVAKDETTPADSLNQTAHNATSCTLTGTTAAADNIVFSATGF